MKKSKRYFFCDDDKVLILTDSLFDMIKSHIHTAFVYKMKKSKNVVLTLRCFKYTEPFQVEFMRFFSRFESTGESGYCFGCRHRLQKITSGTCKQIFEPVTSDPFLQNFSYLKEKLESDNRAASDPYLFHYFTNKTKIRPYDEYDDLADLAAKDVWFIILSLCLIPFFLIWEALKKGGRFAAKYFPKFF